MSGVVTLSGEAALMWWRLDEVLHSVYRRNTAHSKRHDSELQQLRHVLLTHMTERQASLYGGTLTSDRMLECSLGNLRQ
nr:hypothetical protein CFP56_03361 [Quercus suber]